MNLLEFWIYFLIAIDCKKFTLDDERSDKNNI